MNDPEVRIDYARLERTGLPEVILGGGKSRAQIERIARALYERQAFALATRIEPGDGAALAAALPAAHYDETARILRCGRLAPTGATIGVLCAGTSDLAVAREAAATLDAFGHTVVERYDVGVAGIHRLLDIRADLDRCAALIVVAGMEGALPSVVAGLVRAPVVAVPTSVGYGAAFGGIAALLAMLNACAPGVAVVNIDNGFGGAAVAHKIALGSQAVARDDG
ncbi:MAG: nickel pincer cofactor biosynthesis protein LarB [Vulcanimicrobiaceae bacterium]